jgi:hypothetical protein
MNERTSAACIMVTRSAVRFHNSEPVGCLMEFPSIDLSIYLSIFSFGNLPKVGLGANAVELKATRAATRRDSKRLNFAMVKSMSLNEKQNKTKRTSRYSLLRTAPRSFVDEEGIDDRWAMSGCHRRGLGGLPRNHVLEGNVEFNFGASLSKHVVRTPRG